MKIKPIKIKQKDRTDCGAVCLASIASYHRLRLPISRIRQLASTNKRGTNVLGLIEAATELGFDAKGIRGEFENLFTLPKPAIAHVIVKEVLHHYVTIYNTTPDYIEVMDPNDGEVHRYSHEAFKKTWTGILIILWPNHDFKAADKSTSVLSKFWSLIVPHRAIMIQALFGALFYTIMGLATSVYVQKIIDYVLVDGNRNLLNLMSIVMLIFLAVQLFIGATKSMFTLRTGQRIDAHLILGYYKHLLRLPQQFFDSMRVGEIISRMNDAVKIRTFINDISLNLSVNIFVVLFSFALMFTYYWKLALIMLIMIPLYLIIYLITNAVNKRIERRLMENGAELESQLVESLQAVRTIKSFGLEQHTNIKTEVKFVAMLKTIYRSGINGIVTSNTTEFFSRAFTIVLLWVGSTFVLDNHITPGELLSFYALISYFNAPLNSLIGMNKTIQGAFIAADRLFEIMDLEREKDENKVILDPQMIGDIEFKDVHFRYGTQATVFEDLNLTIPKGKVTALVGESGSGKSTLIAILQNLYPIQKGTISIGEINLQYIDNSSLRQRIGVVPQKIDLFAGNVIENICVGDYQPDMKRIIGICTALGIMDFIEKLPNGFKTYLGENGITLSGGQRQRLALARALYKNPEILMLDEATASLDSGSEYYVQRMIDILKEQEKTIIIIAHRLSTVYQADKIVVIHEGKVVEEGQHQELLNNRSYYYKLWKQQFPMLEEVA